MYNLVTIQVHAAQTAIVNLDSGFTKGVVGFGAGDYW